MVKKKEDPISDDICKRLAFQRGLLTLVKDTVPLFSPMIDKALEDIDFLMEKVG